jgi:4-carboxymuconolactone decarboxylase
MARIPYPEKRPDIKYSDAAEMLWNLNIYRMCNHSEQIGLTFSKLAGTILSKGKLDPVLRELIIVRTGIMCGSKYEVYHHERISRQMGISEEKIASLRTGSSSPVFSGQERLALRFTEEIVENVKASDDTFNSLLGYLDYERMVEIVITIGCYMTVSRFLENFEIDIEKNKSRNSG